MQLTHCTDINVKIYINLPWRGFVSQTGDFSPEHIHKTGYICLTRYISA